MTEPSNPEMSLEVALNLFGFFLGLGLIVGPFILRFTLDRRVRKRLLPADKIYDGPMDCYGGVVRAMLFGFASLFDKYNRHEAMIYDYESVDVKGFANLFEKIISAWFVGGLAFLCIGGVILQIWEWME